MPILFVNKEDFKENFTVWVSDATNSNFMNFNVNVAPKISEYCEKNKDLYRPKLLDLCLATYAGKLRLLYFYYYYRNVSVFCVFFTLNSGYVLHLIIYYR